MNTKNVKNMEYMFSNCISLQLLDLSSFNTQNVQNMDYMFSNCESLYFLDLSSFNTNNVEEMSYMFDYCQLTSENIKTNDQGILDLILSIE